MIIKLLNSTKKEVEYDLADSKKLGVVKGIVSRAVGAAKKERLVCLQKQLQAYHEDKEVAALLTLIASALAKLNVMPEIIISTSKRTHDINTADQLKSLKATITRYGKNKKEAELKQLLVQVKQHLQNNAGHKILLDLQKKLEALIAAFQQCKNYQPYTKLLAENFLKQKTAKTTWQDKDPEHYSLEHNMVAYLDRSVTRKKKRGQDNVSELSASFWLDMMSNLNFFSGKNDREAVILFIVLVKSFFSHNASYYPPQGYGKSANSECAKPLYYIRSQGDHHDIHNYREHSQHTTAYGIQNTAFISMVCKSENLFKVDYSKDVSRVQKNGLIEGKAEGERVAEKLAHLASRSNNVELFRDLCSTAFDKSLSDDFETLKKLIPNPGLGLWNKVRLSKKIMSLKAAFIKLNDDLEQNLYPDVLSAIMSHRSHAANSIHANLVKQQLAFIKPVLSTDSGFISFDLYPEIPLALKDSANVKEGLTNLLIGFFGALLNYNAMKLGLHHVVTRRQSFGFLRSTLTDTGSLRMRLSLGADPEPFVKLITDTVIQFNALLGQYNFADPAQAEKGRCKTLVDQSKQICEAPKGATVTEKTGNYWMSSMRSEDDKWIAFLVGEKYLNVAEGDCKAAFSEYLEKFIINRVDHNKISEGDSKQLSREGYSVVNQSAVKLKAPSKAMHSTIIAESPVLQLLHNLIHLTTDYINNLDPLQHSASTAYLLHKLLRNCQKGKAILNNAHRYEPSHILAKATLVVENLQEYLVPLRFLAGDTQQAIADLTALERGRFASTLNVKPDQCQVFFNDGGLQAINTAIMTMSFQDMKSFYAHQDCYYEIAEFCKDSGITLQKQHNAAKVWLWDITQLAQLNEVLNGKNDPEAIIIDITNNSSSAKLKELAATVEYAQAHNIWITLSCSTLKHEQLGQDKYQSGRNVFIPPPGKKLKRTSESHLAKISTAAANPIYAVFRQMVETVSNSDDYKQSVNEFGMFNRVLKKPVETQKKQAGPIIKA